MRIMKDNNIICLSPFLKIRESNNIKSVKVMNHLTSRIHIIDKKIWEVLTIESGNVSREEMAEKIGISLFEKYVKHKILLEKDEVWKVYKPRFIEIETSSYCNWKCCYCPNSIYSREKEIMPLSLFQLILDRASEYGNIRYISLHGYNEPTIEPYFLERVKMIRDAGFKLVLYTNGSGLKKHIIDEIVEIGVVRNVVFNFPSADADVFFERTGARMSRQIMEYIFYAKSAGLNVGISIQGTREEQCKEEEKIKKVFPDVAITAIPSFDRAGILKNKYCNNISYKDEYLSGCGFVLTDIHIDVSGHLYLCLEDYHKKHSFGNVKDSSLDEILLSDDYVNIIGQIWGRIPASEDLICRKCILLGK